MTDKKIEQLTKRLKELNIKQEVVIRELETLTRSKARARRTQENSTPDAEGTELSIGYKVRITNKGQFKEKNGTITKIGKLVSITLITGQTTTRKSTTLLKQNAGRNDNSGTA